MWRYFLGLCLILAAGVAQAKDQAYLQAMPLGASAKISANGKVLLVNGQEWTKAGGFVALRGKHDLYFIRPSAINADGSVVAGFFDVFPQPQKAYTEPSDAGLFRWTKTDGLQRLNPHLLAKPMALIQPMVVSTDGRKIAFLCGEQDNYGFFDCKSGPLPHPAPGAEKLWTETGITDLSRAFKQHYDFIEIADDFQSFIVGTIKPLSLGRIDAQGHYTAFQGFADPDTDPDLINISDFVFNRHGTIVALNTEGPWAQRKMWNSTGHLLPPLKLLPGCRSYAVVGIDDEGAIFVNAFCPRLQGPYAGEVALRVTKAGAQTIHDWLTSAGLPNALPAWVELKAVSDNGKTIFGTVNGPPAIAAIRTATPPPAAPSADTIEPNGSFTAHVP